MNPRTVISRLSVFRTDLFSLLSTPPNVAEDRALEAHPKRDAPLSRRAQLLAGLSSNSPQFSLQLSDDAITLARPRLQQRNSTSNSISISKHSIIYLLFSTDSFSLLLPNNGGRYGARIHDLQRAKLALSQLS